MPKGKPNTQRWDCRFDHLVAAALTQGYGKEMVLSGIETYERADDIRKGIYRCTRHRKISAEAGPSRVVAADERNHYGGPMMGIRKTGKTYELRFKVHPKTAGRKSVLDQHGPDRSNWAYDPRRKATAEERESWAPRNELGQPVTHE